MDSFCSLAAHEFSHEVQLPRWPPSVTPRDFQNPAFLTGTLPALFTPRFTQHVSHVITPRLLHGTFHTLTQFSHDCLTKAAAGFTTRGFSTPRFYTRLYASRVTKPLLSRHSREPLFYQFITFLAVSVTGPITY